MFLPQAFRQSEGEEGEASIDAASFTTFCQKTPEVTSWIQYCGLVHEVDVPAPTFTDSDAMRVVVREKEVWSGECTAKQAGKYYCRVAFSMSLNNNNAPGGQRRLEFVGWLHHV